MPSARWVHPLARQAPFIRAVMKLQWSTMCARVYINFLYSAWPALNRGILIPGMDSPSLDLVFPWKNGMAQGITNSEAFFNQKMTSMALCHPIITVGFTRTFIVCKGSALSWLLDHNSIEPKYHGKVSSIFNNLFLCDSKYTYAYI